MSSLKLFSLLPLLALITSTSAQALPNPGCITVSLLAESCGFRSSQTHTPHTAIQASHLTCVYYDLQGWYAPDAWDSAVNSCYGYMTGNIASLSTEDLFSINGGTIYPSVYRELFGGLCTKYISTPATTEASTSTAFTSTDTTPVTSSSSSSASTTSPAVTSGPTSSLSNTRSGTAVVTTNTPGAALRCSASMVAYVVSFMA